MGWSPRRTLSAALPPSAQLRWPITQNPSTLNFSIQVDACFKKFDKDKDGMLNFVEFKNFMGKRKSLPDKVTFCEVFLGKRKLTKMSGCRRWLGAPLPCPSGCPLVILPTIIIVTPISAYCTTPVFCNGRLLHKKLGFSVFFYGSWWFQVSPWLSLVVFRGGCYGYCSLVYLGDPGSGNDLLLH